MAAPSRRSWSSSLSPNFPGNYYTEPPGSGSAFGAYWPALIPQSLVEHVVVDADGHREQIPSPHGDGGADGDPSRADLKEPTKPEVDEGPAPDQDTELVDAPLGLVANARSGDKGGSANVGIWVRTPDAWRWLKHAITEERFRQLVPESSNLRVDRYELPRLKALNFVVHGLLDGGATEARRFDKQAKALGEWLRSRHVLVPESLVPDGSVD